MSQTVRWADGTDMEAVKAIPDGLFHAVRIGALCVDMGSITPDNVTEFYRRMIMHQTIFGAWLEGPNGDMPITLADLRRFYGFRTNVATTTPAKFNRQMAQYLQREAARLTADALILSPNVVEVTA